MSVESPKCGVPELFRMGCNDIKCAIISDILARKSCTPDLRKHILALKGCPRIDEAMTALNQLESKSLPDNQ